MMEAIRIDIINPKARNLLQQIAELKLIRIKDDIFIPDLAGLLKRLRLKADHAPGDREIISLAEMTHTER